MRYKIRLTDTGPNEKYKTLTITAERYSINTDGALVFATRDGIVERAFASGEWSRVRPADAA